MQQFLYSVQTYFFISLGLDLDGLYRVSGNLAVIQKLRFAVNHGNIYLNILYLAPSHLAADKVLSCCWTCFSITSHRSLIRLRSGECSPVQVNTLNTSKHSWIIFVVWESASSCWMRLTQLVNIVVLQWGGALGLQQCLDMW